MPVSGSDSGSWTRFRIFGLIPVGRLGGDPDHTRSAFGRYAAEAVIWAPATLLLGPGITWNALGEDIARVSIRHTDLEQAVDVTVDEKGRPLEVTFQRWSNANPEQVPGAIAAVVSGEAVVLRGYGVADLDDRTPVTPDKVRFEIGSITKLFTWVAVMMLVEEGRLDLRADVSGYLPSLKVPGSEPLTLAHLMSHRAGFAESYAIFDRDIAALPRAQALAAAAPKQVFARGEVTSYSNWGAALAGHIELRP